MRGWKHVFYRIKVSFVFHFLRFKSKLHFTNRKLIDNCSLMDNIEFLLQLVIELKITFSKAGYRYNGWFVMVGNTIQKGEGGQKG